MLGSAEATPYDLRFQLLSIPVRVHPLFWLVMLFLSGQLSRRDFDLSEATAFVVCGFISILVHEFGHGLAGRMLGDEPSEVVLYAMGGYCAFHQYRLRRWPKILVLICGPGAGFLLMALVLAGAAITYGIAPMDAMALIGVGNHDPVAAIIKLPPSALAQHAFLYVLEINFWWGVFNLLPIWPLDGGRITGELLETFNRRDGARWGHVISLLTAGCIAIWLLSVHEFMMALWLGYFGYINYQMLQAMHDSPQTSEDPEWWRR